MCHLLHEKLLQGGFFLNAKLSMPVCQAGQSTKYCTLVCRIDVQAQINVQVEKFQKKNKRAGQNRRAGGICF